MFSLTFVRFMHFVESKEMLGMFCFPVASEGVTFTEQQLLQVIKLNGYNVTRIVNSDEMVH